MFGIIWNNSKDSSIFSIIPITLLLKFRSCFVSCGICSIHDSWIWSVLQVPHVGLLRVPYHQEQGVGNVFRKFLWNQLFFKIMIIFEGIFGRQIDSEDPKFLWQKNERTTSDTLSGVPSLDNFSNWYWLFWKSKFQIVAYSWSIWLRNMDSRSQGLHSSG